MGNLFTNIAMGKPDARADYKQFDGVLRRRKGTNMLLDALIGLHMRHHEYFIKISRGEKLEKWPERKKPITEFGRRIL